MRTLANNKEGILSRLCGKYNPKLDYLFCKHLSSSVPAILNEERWRDIFNGKCEPDIPAQKVMLKGKEILSEISEGGELLATFGRIHSVLTGKLIPGEDEKWLCDMAETTGSPAACDTFLVAALYHFREKPMGIEFAKSLTTLLLARCGHPPVCFYQRPVIRIMDETKRDLPSAVNMARNLRFQSESMNIWHVPIPTEEVFRKLRECIPKLEEKYGVKELYVYGSYAKNEADGYSDLDVYLRIDETVNGKTGYSAMGFIRRSVGIPVDGHVTYASSIDLDSLQGEIRRHFMKVK